MGLVGMISGLGGGFGGGALVDWVIRRWDKQTSLTFESRQASLACESVPKLESLVPICQLQTVLSIVGIVFLVVATTVVSRSLFFVTLTMGMSFIFGTQAGSYLALLLSVPVECRSGAVGLSTTLLHLFGWVGCILASVDCSSFEFQ
eukprot:GHVN01060014.1.p3 GENE.GHVN01060014.1~~GHVN01060014.1.p3  ORF type:complete len:147 (+),score=11.84 GHVN01060014.1:807-1247(+)